MLYVSVCVIIHLTRTNDVISIRMCNNTSDKTNDVICIRMSNDTSDKDK
jgi:hypothetical protein